MRVRHRTSTFSYEPLGGLSACNPINGWSNIIVPGMYISIKDIRLYVSNSKLHI